MFVNFLEFFLKKYNIKVDTIYERYITFKIKNGRIRIWFDGRVEIWKNKKLISYSKFDEKKILSYIKQN